jgi:hypothetical protein
MAKEIREELVTSVFGLLLDIKDEGNCELAKIAIKDLRSDEKEFLLELIIDGALEFEKPPELKELSGPVIGGAIDETVELLGNIKEALGARDVGFFTSLAEKSADELNKIPEMLQSEVKGISRSIASLMNKPLKGGTKDM